MRYKMVEFYNVYRKLSKLVKLYEELKKLVKLDGMRYKIK
jgi:hypothetical protein